LVVGGSLGNDLKGPPLTGPDERGFGTAMQCGEGGPLDRCVGRGPEPTWGEGFRDRDGNKKEMNLVIAIW